MATYTVVKGDCLWNIAKAKLGDPYLWRKLADLNKISQSKPTIYPGQVLNLDVTGSVTPAKNNSNKARVEYFGLQAGTDTSVFVTWDWDKSNTDKYKVSWSYVTGNGVWFIGNDSEVTAKQSVYSAPSNATKVRVRIKPISKTHKVNKKDVNYWTAEWSTYSIYDFKDNPPKTPPVPTVKIEDYKLTAEVHNLDINANQVQFQIVKNNSSVFKTGLATIKTTSASFSCTVDAGGEYKVRARGYRSKDKVYGEWSNYSSDVGTMPSASSGILELKSISETSVYIDWGNVKNAKSYDVEYTTEKRYFDSGGSMVKSVSVDAVVGHAEITGMESGKEYFFRVRAVNDKGKSAWCVIKSIVIGKKPEAPTTWSSSTTVMTGEQLTLYWVHNTEDGSSQTFAEVEVTINGTKSTYTVKNTTNEDEKDKTSSYEINTSKYVEGTKILWRVRTSGITKVYGDWSIQRTVDIYAPPTLELSVTDLKGKPLDILESFPFYISALAGPKTQRPIGYHVSISSNEVYETVDNVGRAKIINKGEQVYSKYFDINDTLLIEMSAFNVDLENNIEYTIICTVSMDSGLTAENSTEFTVAWTDLEYSPDVEIGYDEDTYVTYIRAYCLDENETLIKDITLSVYRREFDGSFTELAVGLSNTNNTYVTDPHPALDYARYRVVAITNSTGAVSFYDPPGYPISESAVIIQWDEEWSNFDAEMEDQLSDPPWTGSLLRLPYNINVSDSYGLDVSLIEYIGREHPVSYYGTQIGETANWSVDIIKEDEETLYALRRLARWMGDVYVREPSGSGYWANISVSFSQKHRELVIPVTLSITRVEGGA